MKNLKKAYILTVLVFGSVLISYGQKKGLDSINVHIDNQMKLNMSVYDYKDLNETVEKDLKTLQSVLKAQNDIPKDFSYSITFRPNKMVAIDRSEPNAKVIWENGQQTHYQFNNRCTIYSEKYLLRILFNEFEKLVSDSLGYKLEEVLDSTNALQGRMALTYNYAFHGKVLKHDREQDKLYGQMDLLELKGGVGANLIKNQPVIDLSAELGLTFSKKGILKNQFYLSYNQLFDFPEQSKMNLNGFVNAGYRYNLSHTIGKPNWLGIELGYLAFKQGNLFDKNTFRLGINWEIGKYISISPQLYLSGDLCYPAIRIGFGL